MVDRGIVFCITNDSGFPDYPRTEKGPGTKRHRSTHKSRTKYYCHRRRRNSLQRFQTNTYDRGGPNYDNPLFVGLDKKINTLLYIGGSFPPYFFTPSCLLFNKQSHSLPLI